MAFEAANRGVAVHANDQAVPFPARLLEQINMAGMEQVKAPIREHNAIACGTPLRNSRQQFRKIKNFSLLRVRRFAAQSS